MAGICRYRVRLRVAVPRLCRNRDGARGYTLLSISSSPLPPMPPIVWGAVGFFLAYRHRRWARRGIVMLMFAHYAGIWPTINFLRDGAWNRAPEPALAAVWFTIYLAGQVGAWRLLKRAAEQEGDAIEKRFQFSIRRVLIATLFFAAAAGLMRTGDPMIQILGALPIGAAITVLVDPLL